jgi:hypothetical protein
VQDGKGIFHDVTVKAGIEVSAPTQSAQFADLDNDGDLDLFVGYETLRDCDGVHYQSRLYRNRGDGTFENRHREGRRHQQCHVQGRGGSATTTRIGCRTST